MLEIEVLGGPVTWHSLERQAASTTKWVFSTPVELVPGPQIIRFWSDDRVLFQRDVVVPETGWTITSFWMEPCSEEADQPCPGVRVYTGNLEALRADEGAPL